MTNVYITFGSDHETEHAERYPWVSRNGYFTIAGLDYEEGRAVAHTMFGSHFAFDYRERPDRNEEGKRWYPKGELARLELSPAETLPKVSVETSVLRYWQHTLQKVMASAVMGPLLKERGEAALTSMKVRIDDSGNEEE